MSFDQIETAARKDASRGEWQLRVALAFQTIVLPALIGSMAWFRESILAVGGGFFFVLLAVFVALQFVLFVVSLTAKQSVQDLYFHAKDLKAQKETFQEEVAGTLKRAELYSFIERYAGSCSSSLLSYVGQPLQSLEDLLRVIGNIVEPLVTNGEEIFGFGPCERWNFVVYIYERDRDMLVPVWRKKAQTHPSEGLGREWRRGQGHVGFSFANTRPVITEDSRHPDVKNLVSATEGHFREYDENTYVSYASIPIGPVGDQLEPLGVLVATSDRSGRFSAENSRIFAHAALALANALTVIAPNTVVALNEIK